MRFLKFYFPFIRLTPITCLFLLTSCGIFDPDKKNSEYSDYSYNPYFFATSVIGDTIVQKKELSAYSISKYPNIQHLKSSTGSSEFRMIALGGGFTFGVRDGGIFNYSLETSYPKLIANQMGVNFRSPKFKDTEFNGIGRLVNTTENPTNGPIPKQKVVKNNLGFATNGFINPFEGQTDNYYFVMSRDFAFSYDLVYKWFVGGDNKKDIKYKLEKGLEKFDFAIIDAGLDTDFFSYKAKYYAQNIPSYLPENTEAGIKFNNGYPIPVYFPYLGSSKVVLVKTPLPKYLPYFKDLYRNEYKQLLEEIGTKSLYIAETPSSVNLNGYFNSNVILPSSFADSLLSKAVKVKSKPGLKKDNPIRLYATKNAGYNSKEVEKSYEELYSNYDSWTQRTSTKNNWVIVDLNILYQKINEGTFVTNDGVKVDPKWPKGNFFSSDGIYPTAFGQAIIANEVIKVINAKYGVNIELIRTKEFL